MGKSRADEGAGKGHDAATRDAPPFVDRGSRRFDNRGMRNVAIRASLLPPFASLALLALAGCRTLLPQSLAEFLEGATEGGVDYQTAEGIGSELMGFAAAHMTDMAYAHDALRDQAPDDAELRLYALRGKLSIGSAAVTIAAGPNPIVAMLDMVVFTTLTRIVLEDELGRRTIGPAERRLIEVSRRGEAIAWKIAGRLLTPEQQEELRDLIVQWRIDHPGQDHVFSVRFSEFSQYRLEQPGGPTRSAGSIFQLLFLDPLAGADPVAAEVYQSRRLAERLLFYTYRLPILAQWHLDLVYEQMAAKPDVKNVIGDLTRFSAAADRFAATTERLPGEIAAKLETLRQNLVADLSAEREVLVTTLETQSDELRALLADARDAFEAAGEMAAAIDGATATLHAFIDRVDPIEPEPAAIATGPREGHPFDVREFGASAVEIRAMAAELRQLLAEADRPFLTPAGAEPSNLQAAVEAAQRSATHVLDRAFWYALIVVGALLFGIPLALLAYRAARLRLAPRRPPAP